MHTEYLPFAQEEKGVLPFRIARELGRQAVLLAARDELGLATRDETLGEPFPDAITEAGKDLNCKIRCYFDKSVQIDLRSSSATAEGDESKSTVPELLPDSYDTYSILLDLTTTLEAMSRGELVERHRGLGFSGTRCRRRMRKTRRRTSWKT